MKRTGMILALSMIVMGVHASLLTNGSFEKNTGTALQQPTGSTAITGWTTTLSGVEYYQPGVGNAPDGDWVVDLAYYTSSESGGIEQTIATTTGEKISLDFSLGTLQTSGRDGTAEIKLLINDVLLETYNVTNFTAAYSWEDMNYTHTATGPDTKIEFRNEQNAYLHFALIDGVSASVIPEPASLGLLGVVSVGFYFVRRFIVV